VALDRGDLALVREALRDLAQRLGRDGEARSERVARERTRRGLLDERAHHPGRIAVGEREEHGAALLARPSLRRIRVEDRAAAEHRAGGAVDVRTAEDEAIAAEHDEGLGEAQA